MLAWLKSQNILGSEQVGRSRIVYESNSTELGWKIPLRAITQSIEAKLFYLRAPVVSHQQPVIRDSSDLFYVNEEYENLIQERVAHHYEVLKNLPEISGLIRLVRVLKMSNSNDGDLQTTRQELAEWLIDLRSQNIRYWDENYDAALLIEFESQMRAIEQLLSEVSQD